ncbi:MAG: hypothetical protein RL701_5523 [Pseudomonadota bacterium]|jgi:Ser/Thr protein kinase RdoA (MazF antagonist)
MQEAGRVVVAADPRGRQRQRTPPPTSTPWHFAPLHRHDVVYLENVFKPSDLAAFPDNNLDAALRNFVAEPALRIEPLGDGHLHETFLVEFPPSSGLSRLVLQRVNTRVFTDVPAVMENIARVTAHARARLLAREATDGGAELDRRVLTLRPTRAGATYASAADGQVFRAFDYIANSVALNEPENANSAYEAGRALGEFAQLLADLPAPALHITLPNFHAPEQRFLQLSAALADDPVGRACDVQLEWQSIVAREPLAYECVNWRRDPQLRLRVTHNDTKLNNVLFDAETRRALCVVDLDTVMPGYLAFDFGDLVRTCVCSVAEDSEQLADVQLRLDYFEALARGYLSELASDLTPLEHQSLARGPLWIVLELAMRFLTDYVNGDRYFKIERPDHNLVRARVQLRLLSELEQHQTQLAELLAASRPRAQK